MEINTYAQEETDFKIGLGNEIYLIDKRGNGQKYYHFILIAKDAEGHKQLRRLSSKAWINSYVDRGMERVPTLKSELAEIVRENPGHLISTSSCLGGELSTSILEMENCRARMEFEEAELRKKDIINFVLYCKDLFGDDFYMEVAPANNKEQNIVNKKIIELAKLCDVKVVIGTDAHFLKAEDRYIHKAFLNSKGGERETDEFYQFSYLQTEEEIKRNLSSSIVDSYEEMCANSMEIYDKITIYDLSKNATIPKVDFKEYPKDNSKKTGRPVLDSMLVSDDVIDRNWVNQCLDKLVEIGKYNDEYIDRLEYEADIKKTVSEKLGNSMFAYPLTLQHYIHLIWEAGSMVGAGRGSSCAGLNHFLLGVTQLDPVEWNLPFFRYMNKDRIEIADVDLDVCPSKRPYILNLIKEERSKKFKSYVDQEIKDNCGCTLIATFGTATSKAAVRIACSGYRSEEFPNGIDNDTSQYLSSLIPVERGFVASIKEMLSGKKSKIFVQEVASYPGLDEILLGVEGLIIQRSSHASGVIFFDEDPCETAAFMKTPDGEVITQYDLHMQEKAGNVKYDLLVTKVQDKLVEAIKLLQRHNEIDPNLSLQAVYNKYFHPNVLPIHDEKIWDKIDNVEVLDLFQFDSPVGIDAAKKIKPRSIQEMSDANGLLRLAGEEGEERPMDKYIRFKNDISLWYQEMNDYGLTKEEVEYVRPYFESSYGVPPSQEQLMLMLLDKHICAFSIKEANEARKIVSKKDLSKIPYLQEKILSRASSKSLGKYIYECGIKPQLSYSFSIIHAIAYSFIGFQSAYIATRWNPIYWNTACLLVNSNSIEIKGEEDKKKSNNYDKTATALNIFMSKNLKISLIDINKSKELFEPNVGNNSILYGLKAVSGMNNETIEKIYAGRPYTSFKDFMYKCPLNKTQMLSLIKAGAFDNVDTILDSRIKILTYYLSIVCEPKKKLTLQNLNGLIEKGLIPQDKFENEIRIFQFMKYLKKYCSYGNFYIFNESCESFYEKFFVNDIDLLTVVKGKVAIEKTKWKSLYDAAIEPIKVFIKNNCDELLGQYNFALFKEQWDKYADDGNLSKMEMQAVCFYYHEHELAKVDKYKYGLVDFCNLSPQSEVDYMFKRGGREIPIYKLSRICGTVIAKDDNRSTITLLTTTGVVSVKMSREQYSKYKTQLSEINAETGKKTVREKGWFSRGNMLVITGYRRDDTFIMKTYAKTASHSIYKITEVNGNEIKLQHDRWSAEGVIEEDE